MSEVVEEIKSKIDIVDVIGEHVTLKKAGKNLRGLCPFHGEKTPSFMVSPDLQIFKCFGCGESGDIFTFLQKYEGLDFPQTLSLLADKTGVKITSTFDSNNSHKEELYKVHEKVAQFYQYILLKHPSGKNALEYLLTQRGLDLETIKTFGIGYSPDVLFAMKDFVVTRHKITPKLLQEAGIVYSRGGRTFDRFRGRIVFPLYDHIGRVVGFSGRLMPGMKKDLAKYINSPETEIYHKSKVLFGLNITKNTIKKTESVVLTEGELDMISSWKVGVRNVVAVKGSALTKDHIVLLGRFAKTVCFAFDNDSAGIKAIQRGIELIQDHGFVVKVAQLGEYKDPDEAAQKNPSEYKKAIDTAVPLWDFLIECIFDKYDDKGAVKTQLVSKDVTPILALIEDTIVQAHYAQKVASRLGVSIESVFSQIEKNKKTPTPIPNRPVQSPEKIDAQELLEKSLLASALHLRDKGKLAPEVGSFLQTLKYKKVYEELLRYVEKNDLFDLKKFSEFVPSELAQTVVDLAFAETSFPESEYEGQFDDSFASLKKVDIKNKIREATDALSRVEKGTGSKEISRLQEKLNGLIHELSKIERK